MHQKNSMEANNKQVFELLHMCYMKVGLHNMIGLGKHYPTYDYHARDHYAKCNQKFGGMFLGSLPPKDSMGRYRSSE